MISITAVKTSTWILIGPRSQHWGDNSTKAMRLKPMIFHTLKFLVCWCYILELEGFFVFLLHMIRFWCWESITYGYGGKIREISLQLTNLEGIMVKEVHVRATRSFSLINESHMPFLARVFTKYGLRYNFRLTQKNSGTICDKNWSSDTIYKIEVYFIPL